MAAPPELIIFCVIATLSCLSATFVIGSTIGFGMHKTRTNRLLLALWVADFLQSIGTQISYKWIANVVDAGSAICTFQGFLINFADLSTTFWVCAIAVYTVMYGIYNARMKHFEQIAHAIVWGSAFFLSVIGFAIPEKNGKSFYGSTGYWCWIQVDYGVERMMFHYVWVFFLWGVTLLLYGFMGYRMLSVSQNTSMSSEQKVTLTRNLKRVTRRMAGYPLIFFCVFGPLGIDRIARLSGTTPPKGYFIFAMMLFSSNGLLNAMFYGATRNLFSRFLNKCRHGTSTNTSDITGVTTSQRTYGNYNKKNQGKLNSKSENGNSNNSSSNSNSNSSNDAVTATDTSASAGQQPQMDELTEVVTRT